MIDLVGEDLRLRRSWKMPSVWGLVHLEPWQYSMAIEGAETIQRNADLHDLRQIGGSTKRHVGMTTQILGQAGEVAARLHWLLPYTLPVPGEYDNPDFMLGDIKVEVRSTANPKSVGLTIRPEDFSKKDSDSRWLSVAQLGKPGTWYALRGWCFLWEVKRLGAPTDYGKKDRPPAYDVPPNSLRLISSSTAGKGKGKDQETKPKKRVETDPTILALRAVQRITQAFKSLEAPERSYVMAKLVQLDQELPAQHEPTVPAGPVAALEDLVQSSTHDCKDECQE